MTLREISLPVGTVTATLTTTGLVVARGIPYGRVTRFAAATAFPAWAGCRDATGRGPICPQSRSRLADFVGDLRAGMVSDEQCLTVTVTAPADADGLPVMVWFHGGSYVTGSGEAAVYDADALVREGNVVVVTVSYRLGVFGYLPPEGAGDLNLGLGDQVLALEWVRDNITGFGGDPARVTAFGQSAGADSVFALLLTPPADGLFQRAIMHSAPLGTRQDRAPMTAAMRQALSKALRDMKVEPSTASVEQLLEAQALAAAAAQGHPDAGMPYGPLGGHSPMIGPDGQGARVQEVAPRIDLLIGHTAADASPFVALAYREFGRGEDAVLSNPDFRSAVDGMTQAAFAGPAAALVADWRAAGGSATTFRVDWSPTDAPLGACHCIDLPLLFGNPSVWAGAAMLGPSAEPIDQALAQRVRGWWAAFAHDGAGGVPGGHLSIA